jgi:alpha-glucosidase
LFTLGSSEMDTSKDTLKKDVETAWWKRGIIYQIYPRSFQDSNGDGVGDLNGICQRLDYLTWLGVDIVWISPIYPSPMADFGYDITDYCNIDPLFGTLFDFDRLLQEAHRRGIKVILDFVPNHTSDQHPWFRESRSSWTSGKRDWYIWRDGKADGGPPNNWLSQFGGSAWSFDGSTGQYYLHSFLSQQPDLNWRNPEVRDALFNVLRFWLDRGVDGFRVDVLWLLLKDVNFRDNPPNPNYRPNQPGIDRYLSLYNSDQPEIHELVAEIRSVLDTYLDRVLVGEIYLPFNRLVSYYGKNLEGAQLPFNFALIHAAWNAKEIGRLISDYEKALPRNGWPTWVLGNHDQPRIAARVGIGQARNAAMLLLTLRGTPTMYYGDEIGLTRVPIPPNLVQDLWEKNEPGLGVGRDPSRTPFQWDASSAAGFTQGTPWLPLDPDYHHQNVATLKSDPRSLLCLYRRLIELRGQHRALSVGDTRVLPVDNNVLSYERFCPGEKIVVALNLGQEDAAVNIAELKQGTALLSTLMDSEGPVTNSRLRGGEGIVCLVR